MGTHQWQASAPLQLISLLKFAGDRNVLQLEGVHEKSEEGGSVALPSRPQARHQRARFARLSGAY